VFGTKVYFQEEEKDKFRSNFKKWSQQQGENGADQEGKPI
jgi:hypothetical protein